MWRRAAVGYAFGLAFFGITIFWMSEFHAIGFVAALLFTSTFPAAAAALVPATGDVGRALAFPAAIAISELVRGLIPFGGVPVGGLPLGQAGSPFVWGARIGGHILVLAVVAAAAVALLAAVGRRAAVAAVAAAFVVGVPLAGAFAPDGGGPTGTLRVAAVQGGGRRGFTAVESDARDVYDAHIAAAAALDPDENLDLVLLPENVIDTNSVERSPLGDEMSDLARHLDTVLVVGVTEDSGEGDTFRNDAVAWDSDGRIADRYTKNQRVPFGEYIPMRSLIERVADLSVIPRDAAAGRGAGVLETEAGTLGVTISYEVYFARRARAAARGGAELLLVPTNAASFSTSQVPDSEVAAARLRAIETGRDVVQAAPTGFTAIIDAAGEVRQRTALGTREVLRDVVATREGRTLYVRWGDWPIAVLAAAALAGPHLTARSRKGRL